MTGFVYAISDGNGCVKIGWSRDPLRRMTKIRTDCSTPVKLLGLIPASKKQEAELHHLLKPWRVRREWFRLGGPVVAVVEMLPKPKPAPVGKLKPSGLEHPLRTWRKANGITLAALSRSLGVSLETIVKWENEKRMPRPRAVLRICEVTGLSPAAFYRQAAQ